ncbi:putative 2-oxoglutarate decarboxylase [Cocos nucifera]|uniref:Putative 2-oxoglutarate decarboxylase n=1 Tax=Cocos nucifera TaxID=13894 RepID=A0A8K0IFP9_COCNU|nr:putative 2-oxoglutarate decarboxylase [Cocos nucifera]
MLFHVGGGGVAAAAGRMLVRYFSRKRSPDLRRISPKVPREEAKTISKGLYDILKDHGPLTVSNTWDYAKEAGIGGMNSKTHMKILLKWMTGRKMVKLSCTHIGSAKKFHYSILPEEPLSAEQISSPSPVSESTKPSTQGKRGKRLG